MLVAPQLKSWLPPSAAVARPPAPFLPTSRAEMEQLGWSECDVIIVTGDAYVDHPSFGMAVIGRVLEAQGFRVGIIAQPDWRSAEPFRALGRPRLFFGVTAGNMDSMVNRYTSDRRVRSDDAYTPDGKGGSRPDRSVIVYAQRVREAYKDVPLIIGSIEASLRRIAHFDYWSEKVRRSILLDAKADLLVFGNAERQVMEIARRLDAGEAIDALTDIRGTAYVRRGARADWIEIDSTHLDAPGPLNAPVNPYALDGRGRPDGGPVDRVESAPSGAEHIVRFARRVKGAEREHSVIRLPSYEQVVDDPVLYAHASRILHLESNPGNARALVQRHGDQEVWLNPPPVPLSMQDMDWIYELPYQRKPHPRYGNANIPAYKMIRFSVSIQRGCFGGCTFCSITEHEGRIIQNRSEGSVLREIEQIRDNVPGFTGVISDLGGPTANMYRLACKSPEIESACRRPSCVFPGICPNLNTDHSALIQLYRRARELPGVKKVLIASGVRYDLASESPDYVRELAQHHVGGYLKIAPEHVREGPLAMMMKPGVGTYDRFKELFDRFSKQAGKEQYLIPYFIAAHPGTTDEDMLELALWLKRNGFRADQVQAFLPSPMATATAMYHSGRNPLRRVTRTSATVPIPKGLRVRRLHKAFLRYHDANNWPLLREALRHMGRTDLIGPGRHQLIPSWQPRGTGLAREGQRAAPARGAAKPAQPIRTQHTGLPRTPPPRARCKKGRAPGTQASAVSPERPADSTLAVALRAALAQHRDAVLQAPPGAGKSTLVPLALLDEPWMRDRKILLLEPRRVAARAIARRMASLLGESVGATVGYRMRLDTKVSRDTRIEVITEGVLTRMLQSDPELGDVGCLIFDEFHERSLQADLGLALCLDARAALDASFRVLVMSATLDGARVSTLLGNAPVVDVPGRQFPVEIVYAGRGAPLLPGGVESPERLVAQVVRRALGESSGDLLVFLPGTGEIRRVQSLLADLAGPRMLLLPLYGDLDAKEQDAALSPSATGARRIVLATNIAETSVTIPGVTVVVDAGLARRSRFDPVTGMSRLEVTRISRAAADQRAGRAGRTAPGRCYRLWSEGSQASLAAFTPAEITEADLSPLALELAQWGNDGAKGLAWMDAPPAPMLEQARDLLQRLEALDEAGVITPLGREMAVLPMHPRLAHMLLASRARGALSVAAELAALLSERDLLRQGGAQRDPDVRTRLEMLRGDAGVKQVERPVRQRMLDNAAQFARLAERSSSTLKRDAQGRAHSESAATPGLLLAMAFPDRIGKRRAEGSGRYLLSNGRGAAFPSATGLSAQEYIVAVELDDRDREARIDLAAPLDVSDLEALYGAHFLVDEQVEWDSRAGAVVAQRSRRFGALVIEQKPLQPVPQDRAIEAMLAGIRQLGVESLPWDEATRNLQARLEFVRRVPNAPHAPWPASDDESLLRDLDEWLPRWLAGITRREQLSRVPLADALMARLSGAQRRALEELAPRELAVPSGSRIRIDYTGDGAPAIAVRLQEVFGWRDTPRIGGGAIPVALRLLSPAQRPVQITRDLAGFWKSSYAEVRKEMRGRYPKHNWPEDPLSAPPTRGARRRI